MKTDTAFRNSSLENLFLKVVVLGTSKHWSYRTDLLVFCLKFGIIYLSVRQLVLYNITNNYYKYFDIYVYIYKIYIIYIYIYKAYINVHMKKFI